MIEARDHPPTLAEEKQWLAFLRYERGGPKAVDPAGRRLLRWHESLKHDKGGRASLRRAQDVDAAFEEPLFHHLRLPLLEHYRLEAERTSANEGLARAALAVAEIDEDHAADEDRKHRLGAVLAKPSREGKPLSLDRFRLLVATPEPALFLRLLRGALVMAGRKAPVLGTAQLMLDWHDLGRRAEVKRRLMLDYFEAASDDLLKEDNG